MEKAGPDMDQRDPQDLNPQIKVTCTILLGHAVRVPGRVRSCQKLATSGINKDCEGFGISVYLYLKIIDKIRFGEVTG